MLPETDGRLLLPTESTLGRLMLEGVLKWLAILDEIPWTEVPLAGTMLAAEFALVKAPDRMFVAETPLVLKLLKTSAATELTTLMVSFARFVELEEPMS
jgi:hypothetical protein